jgi:hypothetical protein
MQNREELRQKGHDGSRKTTCSERGKKYNFQKGGGNKYRFRTEILTPAEERFNYYLFFHIERSLFSIKSGKTNRFYKLKELSE